MLTGLKKIVEAVLIALIIVNLWLADYATRTMNSVSPASQGKQTLMIEKGSSPMAVARILKDNQLIRRSFTFRLIYSLYYYPQSLKAGEYQFSLPVSQKKIMLDLVAGRVVLHALTVPEGLTYLEVAGLLAAKNYPFSGSFARACQQTQLISDLDPEARNLEGYLYPETYYFTRELELKRWWQPW